MAYLANDKYEATLSSGYTTGQTTLYVSAVPDNVPTIIVAAKGTDNETVFSVTGKTVNSLTGVARLRGANVNLDATTPITCLNNEEFVNQYENSAQSAEAIASLIYAVDGGSTDDYAISLDPAPSEYAEGLTIAFKANTANTGTATLDVNSLGQVAIKKNTDKALESGDIEADSVVIVVYDGTNFQLQTPSSKDPYRTITLMPGFLKPTTTAGCASSTTVEAGTNDIDYDVLDFDKASDENAFANFQMPDSWDGGVVQFRYTWTSAGGSAAETVVLELSGRSFANDDAIDQAAGTPIEVSDALIATGDIHTSSWSGDVTLTGATAGEWVHVELMRDVSEDNLDSDARLIALQVRYKQASYSD
jgi:hypothetical protein